MPRRRASPRLPWPDEFLKYRGGDYFSEFERRTGMTNARDDPRLRAAVSGYRDEPTGRRGRPLLAEFNAAVMRTVELVSQLQKHPPNVDWIAVTIVLMYPGDWFERRSQDQDGSAWVNA